MSTTAAPTQSPAPASSSAPSAPTSAKPAAKKKDADVRGVQVGNYQLVKTLGEGSFAKVRLAVHRPTGQQVAIKCIDKNHLPDEYSVRNMYREAQIMKLLDHPNIIRLYEVIETKNEINLVLSYASGGEMLDYIVAHGRLKETEAKKMTAQIVDAMIYCHQANVVHRDLKCENLLLDDEMNIQITDFGLSNVFEAGKKLKTFCGSPVYSAPELIEGVQYIGPEVDVWALGVIIFAMVVGELPFADRNIRLLQQSIIACRYQVPAMVSESCKDLLSRMLVVDRRKRFSMLQVRNHSWLKGTSPSPSATAEILQPLQPPSPTRPKSDQDMDPAILHTLTEMGFDRDACIESVLNNKQDQRAATYFLLLHHRIKSEARKKAAAATAATSSAKHALNPLAFASAGVLPQPVISSEAMSFISTDQLPGVDRKAAPGSGSHKSPTTSTDKAPKFFMPKQQQQTETSSQKVAEQSQQQLPADTSSPGSAGAMTPVIRRRSRAQTVGAVMVPSPLQAPAKQAAAPTATSTAAGTSSKQLPLVAETVTAKTAASRRHSPLSTAAPIVSAHVSTAPHTDSIVEGDDQQPHSEAKQQAAHPAHTGSHMPSAIQRILSSAKQGGRKRSQTVGSSVPPLIRAATSNSSAEKHSATAAANNSQILTVSVVDGSTQSIAASSSSSMAPSSVGDSTNAMGGGSVSSMTDGSGSGIIGARGSREIRTVRFAFNLLTTTSLQPPDMIAKLQAALRQEDVKYTQDSFTFACTWSKSLDDDSGDSGADMIKFEAEICKVPRLALHGIRLKRISGDIWEYKRLCTRFMKKWELQLHAK